MQRLEIAIRPPLPKTVDKLRERYRQLKEAKAVIEEEMKAILSTHHDMGELRKFTCYRCHHTWEPKINRITDPKQCPNCHSSYWNRPKMLARVVKPVNRVNTRYRKGFVVTPDPVVAPTAETVLTPPPTPPLSLKERLAQMAAQTDDAMQIVETIQEEKLEEAAIEAINLGNTRSPDGSDCT